MKIDTSTINKICITEVPGLDPVSVYLEDFGPGKGKIIITCYDQSWTSYWGAMGDRSIAVFFKSCDNGYLVKNLSRGLHYEIDAPEQISNDLIKIILKKRKALELSEDRARELFDEAENLRFIEADEIKREKPDLLYELYGDEWWCCLPKKPNPDYIYLCKIIDAVKAAL